MLAVQNLKKELEINYLKKIKSISCGRGGRLSAIK